MSDRDRDEREGRDKDEGFDEDGDDDNVRAKDHDWERNFIQIARAAIDEDEIEEMLTLITDDDCDDDAVRALHEVTVKHLLRDVLASVEHARIRGRCPTGDDVGDAVEQLRDCSGRTKAMEYVALESSEPVHGWWVD